MSWPRQAAETIRTNSIKCKRKCWCFVVPSIHPDLLPTLERRHLSLSFLQLQFQWPLGASVSGGRWRYPAPLVWLLIKLYCIVLSFGLWNVKKQWKKSVFPKVQDDKCQVYSYRMKETRIYSHLGLLLSSVSEIPSYLLKNKVHHSYQILDSQ